MWLSLVSEFFASARADDSGPTAAAGAGESIPEAGAPVAGDLPLPEFDGKIPTAQQLLEVLDSMTGISEEEKTKLKEDLLRNVQERAAAAQADMAVSDFTTQTLILLSLLAVVALIFVFFVYKLFKCLSEKEQKREEKRRSKQLKKRK